MVLLTSVTLIASKRCNVHTPLYQDNGTNHVLVEEFTGTTCSWCPDGSLVLEQLHKKFGDSVIIVSLHADDSMEVERFWMDDGFHRLYRFMPSACINRRYYDDLPNDFSVAIAKQYWSEKISKELTQARVCDIAIDSISFTANAQRKVEIWTRFTPLSSDIVNVRLNIYVVEDSVSGKGDGYDQSNVFSGKKGYENHPYYNKSDPIVNYVHRHVLRYALGDAFGLEGSLPDTAFMGRTLERRFTLNLSPRWNVSRTKIVAVAQMYDTALVKRKIVGATQASLPKNGLLSTYDEQTSTLEQKSDILVFSNGYVQIPSVALENFTNATVRIYSISGQIMQEWILNKNDSHTWNIYKYGLPNGFYIITLSDARNIQAFQCICLN